MLGRWGRVVLALLGASGLVALACGPGRFDGLTGGTKSDSTDDGGSKKDAAGPAVDVTRPISPLSGSYVMTQKPTLRWHVASDPVVGVDLCPDQTCATVTKKLNATGKLLQVDVSDADQIGAYPPVVYWRLRTKSGATMPVWQLTLTTNANADFSWGMSSDPNADGAPDLIFGLEQEGKVLVYPTNRANESSCAQTAFAPVTIKNDDAFNFGANVALAGDVDGDGLGDLVVRAASESAGPSHLYLLFGAHGAGIFDPKPVEIPVSGASPTLGDGLAGGGDIDGDGYADVVARNGSGATSNIVVLWGAADGLGNATVLTAPSGAPDFGCALQLMDLDADGHADIVASASCGVAGGRLFVIRGADGRTLGAPNEIKAPKTTSLFASHLGVGGDLHQKGRPNVFVSGSIGWLLSASADGGLALEDPDGGLELAVASTYTFDPGATQGFEAQATYGGGGSDNSAGVLADSTNGVRPLTWTADGGAPQGAIVDVGLDTSVVITQNGDGSSVAWFDACTGYVRQFTAGGRLTVAH
jgi:hypothetical protein